MVTILDIGGLDRFKHRFDSTETILIPIFSDTASHPCNNKLCLLYVRFLDYGDVYIIPFDHSESPTLIMPSKYLSGDKNKFVPNRKEIRHTFLPLRNVLDTNLLQYVNSGQSTPFVLEDTTAHKVIKRNYPNQRNINRVIPLSKHIEACEVLSSKMLDSITKTRSKIDDPAFHFLNNNAIDVFQQIEHAGIHISRQIYKKHFGENTERYITKDDKTFSEYNLFTTTGRPSNRFGGINFAALNKEDGSRSAFTSRFGDNGMLVLIDYEAYHLRLIAELIGFKFPDGSIHDYLGRIYFNTNELTEEQYNESKKTSFQLLYGGVTDEYKHVPFFAEVQKFSDYLWELFQKTGYIISPIGQRKLYGTNMTHMHPQKLLSYLIQLHETEHNIMTLEKVLPLFDGHKSKLFLYTYDSVLIDFHQDDGADFIRRVKTTLECENTYSTKVYVGSNYHDLVGVTDCFRS